ncbi:UNVERIFIED_CONTAM: Leucine-rich repeat and calponin y domain-containing protein 3 [Gekko kuhli]
MTIDPLSKCPSVAGQRSPHCSLAAVCGICQMQPLRRPQDRASSVSVSQKRYIGGVHCSWACHEELYSSRPYGALDSGFNSVDSGDKRWSGNEPTDEFSDLPLRVAEITKEQRLRRESQYQENRGSMIVTNGGVEHDLDQIDFIDSCVTEEEEEEARQPKSMEPESLSSQFMAYIERRISHEKCLCLL